MHVASLTSATTVSTQSRNCGSITDKGCSVLSIACDMPVSLVTEYITANDIEIIVYYYCYYWYYFFYQLQELFLVSEQGWKMCNAGVELEQQ